AIFHDDGLLVVTLHVRQRFGEDAGDIVGRNGHRGIPGNPAVAPAGGNVAARFSEPPARAKEASSVSKSKIRPSPRKRGPSSSWILAISAFTRVHSPSKTGVNALHDALCAGMNGRALDSRFALSRPALLDEPCDGGSQLGYAGAGERGGHEYLRMSRGMVGESCFGRGDERRELGGLGR